MSQLECHEPREPDGCSWKPVNLLDSNEALGNSGKIQIRSQSYAMVDPASYGEGGATMYNYVEPRPFERMAHF